ncbi:response regulator [candidate division CSSED10-310 bacterium]|uniref:Response regulator n=1 Tax=candidate division CSSED10-310 bacterium TaxID=2855610 RepID=A0ABV6YZJ9_UNCC1
MKKILIVEDSSTMRNLLQFSLSRIKNVEITASVHGVDALRKISKSFFDLIITDINMPFMDGLKLIRSVKEKKEYSEVPIIIITTRGQDEDRERGLRLGASAYLSKPVKTFELLKVVRGFLDV